MNDGPCESGVKEMMLKIGFFECSTRLGLRSRIFKMKERVTPWTDRSMADVQNEAKYFRLCETYAGRVPNHRSAMALQEIDVFGMHLFVDGRSQRALSNRLTPAW